jgi:hypothetical protein
MAQDSAALNGFPMGVQEGRAVTSPSKTRARFSGRPATGANIPRTYKLGILADRRGDYDNVEQRDQASLTIKE